MQEANDLLEKYKKHPFARGLIPFQGAVRVVNERFAKVFAKMDGRQRWTMCDRETGNPAIFSHAAVFVESDDQETGNYVPDGQVTPFGVDAKSVQRRPNMKCLYTYIFDTFTDMSLYEGQWALDEYMQTVKGFNEGGLPRRQYLSGLDPRYRSRFWMQTPMFLRRGNSETRIPTPGYLHPWVAKADSESKGFRANPDRPRLWMKAGDAIVPISECTPPTLHRGDVVAFSFTVTYHITMVNWFAQFHPVDLVVVKDGDVDATDYSAPALGLHMLPPPALDMIPEEDSTMEDVQHTTTPVTPEATAAMDEDAVGDPVGVEDGGLGEYVAIRLQETMDVDVATAQKGTRDGAHSEEATGPDQGDKEGDQTQLSEDFYEVTADGVAAAEEKLEARPGTGKGTRSTRRRT